MNQTHPRPTGSSEEAIGYHLEEPFGFDHGQKEIRILCPHSVSQMPYSRIHKKLSPEFKAVRNKTLMIQTTDIFI